MYRRYMETITNYLKGKRTYVTIGLLTVVAIQAVVQELTILPPDVTAIIIPVLGALAVYFRSLA